MADLLFNAKNLSINGRNISESEPEPEKLKCLRCSSTRIMEVNAKCSDLCNVNLDGKYHDGYVPDDLNLCNTNDFGGGDYVGLMICVNCGQVQGKWPLPENVMDNIDD